MLDRYSRLEWKFSRIAKSLHSFELRVLPDDQGADESDLFRELVGKAKSQRFLGYYSKQGLETALQAYGIFDLLLERGYPHPELELDLSRKDRHRLMIYDGHGRGEPHLLLDFAAHLGGSRCLASACTHEDELFGDAPVLEESKDAVDAPLELLVIDWLLLQMPGVAARPGELLPGQKYPGLGIGEEILALIGRIAHRLGLDGCLTIPAWYHTAVMLEDRRYTFVDPTLDGRFRALRRDLHDLSLHQASWAIERGEIRAFRTPAHGEPTGPFPFRWTGRSQVWALSKALEAHFHDPEFVRIRREGMATIRYERVRARPPGGRDTPSPRDK